jgi:hypothetical protein
MITLHRDRPLQVSCKGCGSSHTLMVNATDVANWEMGEYIQDAMPYLSADERELLISRTCGSCWDEMFGSCGESDCD